MNRRGFLGRLLAGAALGLARNLPMPAVPKPPPRAARVVIRTALPVPTFRRFHEGVAPALSNRRFEELLIYGSYVEENP